MRYQLNSVPGVAEVASVGGVVRQYQVDVDPNRLRAFRIPVSAVVDAVMKSNRNVGGNVVEGSGTWTVIRGLGLIESVRDLERLVLTAENGTPVYVGQIADVKVGDAFRVAALMKGTEEAVGGVVVARSGVSTVEVIARVKEKIAALQAGLPPGVRIVPFYDRSSLIQRAVDTLKRALIEEILVVTAVNVLFLLNVRSVLIVTIPLPLAVLVAFIFMRYLGISSNIMSLAGIAIAIGVLVDAAIVVTENCFRLLEQRGVNPRDRARVLATVLDASRMVGRPIFFSMAIILLAFIPVFALTGQEGKLFHPLAFTKTFSMAGATLLSVTLVPVLCALLIGGRIRGEERNPVMRPLRLALPAAPRLGPASPRSHPGRGRPRLGGALALVPRFGREFMPPLNEGDLMFMPIADPAISLPQALAITRLQNEAIQKVPEVALVVAKIARADTSTDPAPLNMTETVVALKPRAQWRPGHDAREAHRRAGRGGHFARRGQHLDPAHHQPHQHADHGHPLRGRGEGLRQRPQGSRGSSSRGGRGAAGDPGRGRRLSGAGDGRALSRHPCEARGGGALRHHARRHPGRHRDGHRRDEPHPHHRGPAALSRPRPLRARLSWKSRGARQPPVPTPSGAQVPLAEVADIRQMSGPAMIGSENGLLVVSVLLNVRGRDVGSFIEEARRALAERVTLPPGSYLEWSGQYENEVRARQRLQVVVPVVLAIIFVLLYLTYHSALEAAHVLLAVPFALSGGIYLLYALGYNVSVAVWVGFIALFGTAVQTAVVMVIYLEEAVARKREALGGRMTRAALLEAVTEGALLRLRPKVMTVSTIVASLLPIMWSDSTGAEVMKPLATPVLGGMVSSLAHVLLVTPVIFFWLRERELRRAEAAGVAPSPQEAVARPAHAE